MQHAQDKSQDFLTSLSQHLRALPEDQKREILADYEAHFHEARLRGKSEEQILAALGDPQQIARSFVADYHLQQIQNPAADQGVRTTLMHLLRAILVLLPLFFFNFFLVLWPVLFVSLFLALLWLALPLLVLTGLFVFGAVVSSSFVGAGALAWKAKVILSLYSLGGSALSLAACILLYWVSRLCVQVMARYIKLNIHVISR